MQVLFVSPFFYPEEISTGKWNYHVCRELAKRCKLTVFCLHPFYPEWKVEESDVKIEDMSVIRVGRYLRFPKRQILRRLTLETYFFWALRQFLKNNTHFQHIIYVIPPSLGLLATRHSDITRITGVVHDLQIVHIPNNKLFGPLLSKLIAVIEARSFRRCQSLIYLSHEMMELASNQYRLSDIRQQVCYPFVTIDRFEDSDKLDATIPRRNDEIRLVYSGALGAKQNPNGLYELLNTASLAIDDCTAYIFSAGPEFERLRSLYGNKSNVLFRPLVGEKYLPELLLRSTVQIIPQAAGTSGGSLPSKLPNILASGAGVFAITDENSELERMLLAVEGTQVSNTWSVSGNIEKIRALVDECAKTEMQTNQRNMNKFKIGELISKLLER